MKNTVIQSLINDIKEIQIRGTELTTKGIVTALENALEEEKTQIINAFEEGISYEQSLLGKVDYPASRYYNITFNNSEQK